MHPDPAVPVRPQRPASVRPRPRPRRENTSCPDGLPEPQPVMIKDRDEVMASSRNPGIIAAPGKAWGCEKLAVAGIAGWPGEPGGLTKPGEPARQVTWHTGRSDTALYSSSIPVGLTARRAKYFGGLRWPDRCIAFDGDLARLLDGPQAAGDPRLPCGRLWPNRSTSRTWASGSSARGPSWKRCCCGYYRCLSRPGRVLIAQMPDHLLRQRPFQDGLDHLGQQPIGTERLRALGLGRRPAADRPAHQSSAAWLATHQAYGHLRSVMRRVSFREPQFLRPIVRPPHLHSR